MYQEQSFEEQFEDLEELIRQFESMLSGGTSVFIDEESFMQIIDYYDDHSDINRALIAADMGIGQFPYCSDLQVKKAALLNATGQYERALSLLENADILNPTDVNLYVHKVDAYLGLNQYNQATAVLSDNIGRFHGVERSELLLELNDVFDDWKEFDEAFECLVLLLKEDPTHEEALQRIGFSAEYTGRVEESIKLHKNIIDNYPYNAQAWFNLGCAFQEIKLYEKAIDAFQYVIAIDETFENAYRYMADSYIRLRKYTDAIEALRNCMQLAPADSPVFEALGYCFEKKREYEKARGYYRKAIALIPQDDHLYFRVGRTFMMELSWKQAIRYLSSAHRIAPDKAGYHLAMGECYLQIENHEEAIMHFMEAVQIKPSAIRYRLALIRGLYLAGYTEEALHQLDVSEMETRQKVDFYYYRCAVLLALGKTKEALLQLETGLSESPGKLKILLRLDPAILQHSGVVEVLIRHRRHL